MSHLKKADKVYHRKKNDVRYIRLSAMFLFACFAVLLTMRLVYSPMGLALQFWRLCRHPAYIAVTGLLFVASTVNLLYKRVIRPRSETFAYITGGGLFAACAYIFFGSLYFGHANNPAMPLFVGTILLVLLYYIFYFYRKDFFLYSAESVIMAALLWAIADRMTIGFVLAKAALILVAIAFSLAANRYAARYNGVVSASARKGAKKGSCTLVAWPTYVLSGVFAVLLFAGKTTLINMLLMLALYAAAAIYYTILLLKDN